MMKTLTWLELMVAPWLVVILGRDGQSQGPALGRIIHGTGAEVDTHARALSTPFRKYNGIRPPLHPPCRPAAPLKYVYSRRKPAGRRIGVLDTSLYLRNEGQSLTPRRGAQ